MNTIGNLLRPVQRKMGEARPALACTEFHKYRGSLPTIVARSSPVRRCPSNVEEVFEYVSAFLKFSA